MRRYCKTTCRDESFSVIHQSPWEVKYVIYFPITFLRIFSVGCYCVLSKAIIPLYATFISHIAIRCGFVTPRPTPLRSEYLFSCVLKCLFCDQRKTKRNTNYARWQKFLVRKNSLVFQNSYLRKQNEDNRTDRRNTKRHHE